MELPAVAPHNKVLGALQTNSTSFMCVVIVHSADQGEAAEAAEGSKKKRPAARVYTKQQRQEALMVSRDAS